MRVEGAAVVIAARERGQPDLEGVLVHVEIEGDLLPEAEARAGGGRPAVPPHRAAGVLAVDEDRLRVLDDDPADRDLDVPQQLELVEEGGGRALLEDWRASPSSSQSASAVQRAPPFDTWATPEMSSNASGAGHPSAVTVPRRRRRGGGGGARPPPRRRPSRPLLLLDAGSSASPPPRAGPTNAHPAVVEEQRAVAELLDVTETVRHEDDRHAACRAARRDAGSTSAGRIRRRPPALRQSAGCPRRCVVPTANARRTNMPLE